MAAAGRTVAPEAVAIYMAAQPRRAPCRFLASDGRSSRLRAIHTADRESGVARPVDGALFNLEGPSGSSRNFEALKDGGDEARHSLERNSNDAQCRGKP